MVNYQLGKIYKIIGGSECYIGSTAEKYLSNRYGRHKSDFKRYKANKANICASYYLFDTYGVDNCYIEIIEVFPCNFVEELKAREGFHQRNIKCVNIKIEGRTQKEYRDDYKEHYIEISKSYREKHKEKLNEKYTCECGKELRLVNKKRHNTTAIHKDKIKNIPTL